MSEDSNPGYSPSTLEQLTSSYSSIHGVLSLVVCAFGIPMNVLNISILTRKKMRTPVNCILTWLAIFDLLTMTSYVPFSLHFYCLTWNMSPERNSLSWMTFLIFHSDFTSTTHTISIWLGVTLAMFRYKHIFSPAKGHLTRARRLIRARIAVFGVVILSVLVMIPNYLMNRLKELSYNNPETNETETMFIPEPVNMETEDLKPLAQASLLLHSALAKLLPCILMVVYGGLLVKTLRTNIRMVARRNAGNSSFSKISTREPSSVQEQETSEPRSKLLAKNSIQQKNSAGQNHEDHKNHLPSCNSQLTINANNSTTLVYLTKPAIFLPSNSCCSSTVPLTGRGNRQLTRHRDNSRTTRMLLVVITLFLVTELPQAVLIVLSATITGFFLKVYVPLGDVMDMVALVNNGINFLLYCIMSRDFRTTLLDMLKSVMDRVSAASARLDGVFHKSSTGIVDQPSKQHSTLLMNNKHCTL
ncbi:unnamed protein product [Candidula unifasciata]|uniref:G-protein coupled receptors family 1 profile domain-containing protein n=1 Tax=Candidula unifasciata TaxID=100452 RepID=A0A8S3ZKY0_9EUPU|nr:unnamed protein product [Candidula unifasciata]